MAAETWFTAKEALENGLVDRIYDGEPVDNKHDLSLYANAPDCLKTKNQGLSKRKIEKALRDVGLSNKEAKEVIAGKFKDDLRDEDIDETVELDDKTQRDVEDIDPKGSVNELLTRAEMIAPS